MMTEEDFLQKVHQLAADRARYILNRDPAPDYAVLEQKVLGTMRMALSCTVLDLDSARAVVQRGFGPWTEAELLAPITMSLSAEEVFLVLCGTWAFFTVVFKLRIPEPSGRFLVEEEMIELAKDFYFVKLTEAERLDPWAALLKHIHAGDDRPKSADSSISL